MDIACFKLLDFNFTTIPRNLSRHPISLFLDFGLDLLELVADKLCVAENIEFLFDVTHSVPVLSVLPLEKDFPLYNFLL